jgi:hypothetical protein
VTIPSGTTKGLQGGRRMTAALPIFMSGDVFNSCTSIFLKRLVLLILLQLKEVQVKSNLLKNSIVFQWLIINHPKMIIGPVLL